MRIFVGTLYSGENEFEECLDSIQQQSYLDFQHFIFRDLPNKQAHVTLYKSFLENTECDLLVKVDADMVLTRNILFEEIIGRFAANPWMDLFAIAVHDFFSDQLIWGLNSYNKSVRWDFGKKTIFVDIPETTSDRMLFDNRELAPAAVHCKNPSPYQAFHYGVHRGLKSLEIVHGETHWNLLEQTWQNFQRTKDIRVGFASLGVELAYTGLFGMTDLDYTNSRMKDILGRYLCFDAMRLDHEIKKLRFSNWGILPGSIRRNVLRSFRHRK